MTHNWVYSCKYIYFLYSSSLIGNTVENVSFRYRYNCLVIGLQRKSKIITRHITELPLETGDILLIQGSKESIKKLVELEKLQINPS